MNNLHSTIYAIILAITVGAPYTAASDVGVTSSSFELLPTPREVKATGLGFNPKKIKGIYVTNTSSDRFSASLLRDTMRAVYGIDCDIMLLPSDDGASHKLYLCKDNSPSTTDTSLPSEGEAEGYNLNASANQIGIAAKTSAGLFYGVQTAIQLVEQSSRDHTEIPGVSITDWPSFGLRSLYVEGGQQKGSITVTRAYLETTIRQMAQMKMNNLVIEVYNLVPFKSFPYCADSNTLSLADWNYLVELANSYHVILSPSLQSFAQISEVIWNCDEGKPYRESTAGGMICPSRPENLKFLRGLYKDLMSVFKYSPVIGIGCSEVGMQWVKRYCPLCKARIDSGETLFDIYYKHILACTNEVNSVAREIGRNIRPMMWADEFYMGYDGRRWEGIDNIPKNVVMGHWKYWSNNAAYPKELQDYGSMKGLLDRGYDVIYISASYNFNTYLVDLSPDDPKDGKVPDLCDGGITNIAEQAKGAYRYGLNSRNGKVMGGGCATFSQHDIRCWDTTWYAYAVNAECTWGDPARPKSGIDNQFTDRFAAVFYGARDHNAVQIIANAFRDLDAAKSDIERNNYLIRDIIGEYDTQDGCYIGNNLQDTLKLIDDLAAKTQPPGKTLADIAVRAKKTRVTAVRYRNKLASLIPHVSNTYSLGYLISAAHKIQNHAERTLYMLDQQELLRQSIDAGSDVDRKQFQEELRRLESRLELLTWDTQTLADEADMIAWGRGEYATPWARTADATGYHQALDSLVAFKEMLSQKLPPQ